MSGQDFTKCIGNAFPEGAFAKLAYQDIPISILMRMMADAVQIEDKKDGSYIDIMKNDASRPDQYKSFRRFAMHLESLQNEHQLFVNNLIFDKVVLDNLEEPWNKDPSDLADAVEHGFRWRRNDDGTYRVMKRTKGRVLVSNYDPRSLTDGELYALNGIANRQPGNYVLMDIRRGYPDNELPLFSAIKLCSFFSMLLAVSGGFGGHQQELELDVAPDPRTRGKIEYNPRQTLTINVSDYAPPDDVLNVQYKDRYYWIGDSWWDRAAFIMLNTLFQFTVTDVSDVGIPITISK